MAQNALGRLRLAIRGLSRGASWAGSAVLVVVLLACVLVPLPTGLVDLLLSISLAGAILLLVAGLGVRRPSDLLSFPTLLLIVTLFRLALNLSTTRLILSQAYAGEVVESFASFVVRGDLIVGAVMFLIITIVQYLVIARGAERVAEVSARFALDGLPGHQAAIDADLRSGVISAREAARRRAALSDRSSFYGNMDGAVRFTKYDAIAGLTITSVNLVGGLAIGMGRMGYGWQQSLEVYGRLTIGDGLIAQIPALLVSLAAGVLVARIDRQQADQGTLAWLEPAMLLVPSVLLLMLAPIPGMPTLAFLVTAVVFAVLALGLSSRRAATQPRQTDTGRSIRIRTPANVPRDPRALARELGPLRQRVAASLAIETPELELEHGTAPANDVVELRLGDRVLSRFDAPKDDDALLVAIYRGVMDHADALMDLQHLDEAVERVRASRPAVVKAALDRLSLGELLRIMRAFLRERVPAPPVAALLGVVAETRAFSDVAERPRWGRLAREKLASFWVFDVLDALRRVGEPAWVRTDPQWEQELLDRSVDVDDGSVLDVRPETRSEVVTSIRASALGEADDGKRPVVLLTTPRARDAVASLVEGATPRVVVLSVRELEAARVGLPAAAWVAPTLP